MVISICVFSVFVSLLVLWVPLDVYSLFISVTGILGLSVATMIYIRIYLAVRRHQNQIQIQQVQQVKQTGEFARFSSNIKSSVGVFYVYLVFLVCHLPHLFSLLAPKTMGPSIVLKRFFLFSLTLVCLNSSFNPVIYCWKMGHIRHAVINMLRNMSLFKKSRIARALNTWTDWAYFAMTHCYRCCKTHFVYHNDSVTALTQAAGVERRLYLN